MDKKVDEAFIGEKLNLLVGSLPLGDKETKERFKLHLLNLLFERYGLMEEDLISAELEAVPAGPARDIGWDRSLVGGYGQDDRAAAYPALRAILDRRILPAPVSHFWWIKREVPSLREIPQLRRYSWKNWWRNCWSARENLPLNAARP